ncbi:unnamed protein product [Leptidea sinapis]|uniref:Uncharacterized protein n=1 Tax=Leptidea sinapis TaxID=189913 RepID=A0A5E4R0C5_9NEOP|nr:unnamed protein product [Leptidea sinapis]
MRSETNLAIKCKLCGRENTIDVVDQSNGFLTGDDTDFKTIVVFDCRGIEPIDFEPRSGWIAESANNGTKFQDVDLTSKEWEEYDEKNNVCVSIYELEWRFVKVK